MFKYIFSLGYSFQKGLNFSKPRIYHLIKSNTLNIQNGIKFRLIIWRSQIISLHKSMYRVGEPRNVHNLHKVILWLHPLNTLSYQACDIPYVWDMAYATTPVDCRGHIWTSLDDVYMSYIIRHDTFHTFYHTLCQNVCHMWR